MKRTMTKVITTEVVRRYLLADYGEKLGVYSDGKVIIGQDVGQEIDPIERPIAIIDCVGVGNLDGYEYENQALANNPDIDSLTTEQAINLLAKEEDQDCGLERDRKTLLEELLRGLL